MELLFGVQIDPNTTTTITLDNINLKTKVEELKRETAEKCNLSKDSLELIYCGLILEDDATVESTGLKNGSMVHVLKKKRSETPAPTKHVSEESILQLTTAFKSFNDTPAYRSALHRLSKRPEVIDNIISSSPGLHKDPVAIAMLQDPDLMAHFIDANTVRRVAELHPVLIEAAQNIVAAVHEEAYNASSTSNGSVNGLQSAEHSYRVDNSNVEEEMARDIAHFFATQPPHLPIDDTLHYPNAFLTPNTQGSVRTDNPPSSTSSGSNQPVNNQTNNTGVVTTQMFMEAMRQVALASNPSTQSVPPAASFSPVLPTISPQVLNLQRQLAQMHEMGLQDDMVNVQALQFTNGDVQAAIELVFSGFNENL